MTDANLWLGILDPDWFLGGEFQLVPERVRPALEKLAAELQTATGRCWSPTEIAEGIRSIVNTQLQSALRVISLERGYDTRDFTLVSFGGAAGLHACQLARDLLLPRVLVPPNPGLLSAIGALCADVVKEEAVTVLMEAGEELNTKLAQVYRRLDKSVSQQLEQEGFDKAAVEIWRTADLRYAGQSYELNIPFSTDLATEFHERHRRVYGYANPRLPIEVVTLRVRGIGKIERIHFPRHPISTRGRPQDSILQEKQLLLDGHPTPTKFYVRDKLRPGDRLEGAAVILEYSSTTFVPADFQASVDELLNLVIEPRT